MVPMIRMFISCLVPGTTALLIPRGQTRSTRILTPSLGLGSLYTRLMRVICWAMNGETERSAAQLAQLWLKTHSQPKSDPRPQQIMATHRVGHFSIFLDGKIQYPVLLHHLGGIGNLR